MSTLCSALWTIKRFSFWNSVKSGPAIHVESSLKHDNHVLKLNQLILNYLDNGKEYNDWFHQSFFSHQSPQYKINKKTHFQINTATHCTQNSGKVQWSDHSIWNFTPGSTLQDFAGINTPDITTVLWHTQSTSSSTIYNEYNSTLLNI